MTTNLYFEYFEYFTYFKKNIISMSLLFALSIIASLETYARSELPKGHYILTGVKVTPLRKIVLGAHTTNYIETNRLIQLVLFESQADYVISEGTGKMPYKLLNPTVDSKMSLTMDKDIKFKDQNVPAGTNLLKFQKVDGSYPINITMSRLDAPLGKTAIKINKDFIVPADTYNVTFKWVTSRGDILSDTVKVFIDADLTKVKH